MNDIIKFEGNEVDIIIEDGEPLFEIYSTGMALGQAFIKILRNGEKSYPRKERIDENLENAGIEPVVRNIHKYISESQLYDLMLEMKTDKVKPFRKWLTQEVLPTIRKTGGYVNDEDLFVNAYLPYADENVKQLFKLNLMTIRQLNNKIDYMKPLAEFAETVADSADTIEIGQLAKLAHDENIKIGRTRLFKWLREKKYLRENNEPYQAYIENGWLKVVEQTYNTPYGEKINMKTVVTGKGQIAIIEKLRETFCSAN